MEAHESRAARASLLFPLQADMIVRVLEDAGDYRVLRRLTAFSDAELAGRTASADTTIGCVVDVETTGLDHTRSAIIELAVQRFRFDAQGRICQVGVPRSWREDPCHPLDEKITALTGLTDADLAGQRIDDAMALQLFGSAEVIIAHNAAFDRPFLEARLPALKGLPWACSCRGVDWAAAGFEGASLSQLLMQCGWFYEAHRAETDILALLRLLDHLLPTRRYVLDELIGKARESTFRVNAVGAPFAVKDVLKDRGYRWDGGNRYWTREVAPDEVGYESEWLEVYAYGGLGRPLVHEVTWRERYGALVSLGAG